MKGADELDPPAMTAHSHSGVPPIAAVGIASEGPAGKGPPIGTTTNTEKLWGGGGAETEAEGEGDELAVSMETVGRGCANGAMQAKETTHQSPPARPEHLQHPIPLHDRWVREETGATRTMCGYGEM